MNSSISRLAGGASVPEDASPVYQVVLQGVQPHMPPSEVRAKLAALFKLSVAQVDALLGVPGHVLRRDCSWEVATQYRQAIEGAGGMCELRLQGNEGPAQVLEVELPHAKMGAPIKSEETQEQAQGMFCAQCGTRMGSGAAFCPSCGNPSSSTPSAACQPSKGNPASLVQDTAAPAIPEELPPAWKKTFGLFEKAGGLKLPKIQQLSIWERRRVLLNMWAFLFCPFYYLAKGMWRKAITLSGLCFLIGVALGFVFYFIGNQSRLADGLTNVAISVVFGMRANIDYYKKVFLDDNGWW